MKYYNYETAFASVRDAVRGYLKDNGIYYELSRAYIMYHFEILTDAAGAAAINNFLDSLPDTFTEVPAA